MFTGIIEAMGTVENIRQERIGIRGPWDSKEVVVGQSIAVHGCCLTVVDISNSVLSFDLSEETLDKTFFKNIRPGQHVNLERAMGMGSRFDGHWVTGHVDRKAFVKKIEEEKGSRIFTIGGLEDERMQFVPKGSIAIDGVSLTINETHADGVSVSIIPYTFEHTCFSQLKENDPVHVEFDVIGKYIVRYLENFQQVQKETAC